VAESVSGFAVVGSEGEIDVNFGISKA